MLTERLYQNIYSSISQSETAPTLAEDPTALPLPSSYHKNFELRKCTGVLGLLQGKYPSSFGF